MAEGKKITINNLATKVDDLAIMVKKGFNEIDDLALMTKRGFDEMDDRFEKIREDIDDVKTGQQRIEMRLMNVVYRGEFEKLKEEVFMLKSKMKIA